MLRTGCGSVILLIVAANTESEHFIYNAYIKWNQTLDQHLDMVAANLEVNRRL